VEGSLKMDTWDDKSTGEKRSKIRVQADRVQFLDSRRGDSHADSGGASDDEMAGSSREGGSRPGAGSSSRAPSAGAEPRASSETAAPPRMNSQTTHRTDAAHDDEGEDIPF